MSFLLVENLVRRYGGTAAVDGVSLRVARGSRTAVVGPSGSGKTTLLRLLAGFEAPDAGRIVLDGAVLADGPAAMPAHRRGVGIVAQDGALFPHLSVAENIGFGLDGAAAARRGAVADLMRLVGLDPALSARRPDQVSGGQQQRVALARALARKPRLILLDEPFSALDTGLRAGTRRAVAAVLAQAGITAVLVTHDQAEAMSFADQMAVMRDGRLVQAGPAQELYARPVDPATAAFLGDAVILPAVSSNGWAECAMGRVAVPGAPDGAATMMLRPEQLMIRSAAMAGDAAGCRAVVASAEYEGASCVYALRLPGVANEVRVRQAGYAAIGAGDLVTVTVSGQGHVFATGAAAG